MPLSQSHLSQLSSQLDGLQILLSNFSNSDLRKRPPNGKWSVHEQVCHITRTQDVFFERFEKIIAERMPPKIERYSAEEDKDWPNLIQRSTETTLDNLFRKRKELVEYISQVRDGDLKKKGIHNAFGELTLETWIEFFLAHEAHHFYSIIKLLAYK